MFINRKVFKRKINDITFKSNETKGTIEAFNPEDELLQKWNTCAENYAEFESMTRNLYNELVNNKKEV
jgi:hypothetical protein